jgi:hypothetical protein
MCDIEQCPYNPDECPMCKSTIDFEQIDIEEMTGESEEN